DPGDHEQVAGGTAVAAGGAPLLEPDALTLADPGRDADLDLAGAPLDAGAAAGGARVLDDDAPTVAVGARRAEREQSLVVVGDAPPLADRAHDRLGARLGAGAVAGGARCV